MPKTSESQRRKAQVIRLEGGTYGFLKVLRREGTIKKYAAWRCRCSCGAEVVVSGHKLRRGLRKSCARNGHMYRDPSKPVFDKLTYSSWSHMHVRCFNKAHRNYPNYGGRGIKIDPRWNDYRAFAADMGKRPSKDFSIERIDVNGDYEPGNCRWATREEQARNKQNTVYVTFKGKRYLLMDLVADLGLSRDIVYNRLKLGWPLNHALALPVRPKRKKGRPALD